ncbi:MAG: glycosyltransferase family 39 protein [Anaerolineae bacterium]
MFWPVLLLLTGWALLTINIGGAWVGHQDANGAWISTAVRNYSLYGLQTAAIPLLNTAPAAPAEFHYYTAHPPLAVWMAALPALLIGQAEVVFRFTFASMTLLSAALLYRLSKRLYSHEEAVLGLACFVTIPMIAYFGRMPDHEAPAILWLLLQCLAIANYLQRPSRKHGVVLTLLVVLQSWTAWGGLIVTFTLLALAFAISAPRQRLSFVVIGLIGAAAAASVILYYQSQWSGAVADLINRFLWRTSNQSLLVGSPTFTPIDYVLVIGRRLITLFEPTLLFAAVLGGVALIKGRAPRPETSVNRFARMLPFAFIMGGVLYLSCCFAASYIHDYYLIYITPGVALLGAKGIAYCWNAQRARRYLRPLMVALIVYTPVILMMYLGQLYNNSDSTRSLVIAQGLAHYTTADDWIGSNVPDFGLAVEFYSARSVHWNSTPDEIPSTLETRAFFLSCGDVGELPAALEQYQLLPSCVLLRLQ